MLEFTFSDGLSKRLTDGAAAARDFTVPMRAIADYMRTATVENFKKEQEPDGTPWVPSQRAVADGGLTLTDRGHLRQSIIAVNDATSALAGTNLIYAAIHQFGGPVRGRQSKRSQNVPKPRVMPARPFLGFGPVNVIEIEEILIDHLDNALKAGA